MLASPAGMDAVGFQAPTGHCSGNKALPEAVTNILQGYGRKEELTVLARN
jgi:hypothetical protein